MESSIADADAQHRMMLRGALFAAADHFGYRVTGDPVFGWWDRSVGVQVNGPARPVWLRVVTETTSWAGGAFWTGNVAANTIIGVPKPRVLDWFDWQIGDRWFRAEAMTFIDTPVISRTQELRNDPELPDAWWHQLTASLETLASTRTDRVSFGQEPATRQLREYFADRIDPIVDYWVAAHTDLHWSNLTAPELVILDWEGWAVAPFGYDVATLYCHSLLVPDTAARVHRQWGDVLDTPDGVRSQLLVIARMLARTSHGDYPDLVLPLHRLADRLLGR